MKDKQSLIEILDIIDIYVREVQEEKKNGAEKILKEIMTFKKSKIDINCLKMNYHSFSSNFSKLLMKMIYQ